MYNQLQPYSGWSQIPNGKSLDFGYGLSVGMFLGIGRPAALCGG
jgi:hypothetical protein